MNQPRTSLDEGGFAVSDGYITVYSYNDITGEFVGAMDAYTVIGTGIPGSSTLTEPPETAAGEVALWDGSDWRIEEDHRGETVYSTENQQSFVIEAIGPYPSGFTPLKPESQFDRWDGDKWVLDEQAQEESAISDADNKKQQLINDATQRIVVWQTKLLMGRKLTAAEMASLNQWMDYIDALYAVDTSTAPGIEWPESPA